MLKSLSIRNYAIIDRLDVDFDPQLNIITGETGAGKSIILGALNMILGKRADSSVLRDTHLKAVIEGVFEVSHLGLEQLYSDLEMEYEEETILRREIRPNGKSRAFVNDSPVTLEALRKLAVRLVDLHTQSDTSAVLERNFYLRILDRLAGQEKAVAEFSAAFQAYRAMRKRLQEVKDFLADQQNDRDYLQFQCKELNEANLHVDDGQSLEEELSLLEHAGSIIEQLNAVSGILEENEITAAGLLSAALERLCQVARFSGELHDLKDRLDSTVLEVEDIARTACNLAAGTEMDEQRLDALRERRSTINRLLHKYQAGDIGELIDIRDTIAVRLDKINVTDDDLIALEQEVSTQLEMLAGMADDLSCARRAASDIFTERVSALLREVGMPHASIILDHTVLEIHAMNPLGLDFYELRFSANKGVAPQPLKNVASGGERSRLMLAIKSIIAQNFEMPTMIFDEIDSGISGEVASKVGDIFRELSAGHQIVSITHLPQIAARANRHFYVFKDDSQEQTAARIRILDEDDKVLEIAKMLSGEQPGEAAMMAAQELVV
jgi:DNA repair protein RecN (Recombination protein N)